MTEQYQIKYVNCKTITTVLRPVIVRNKKGAPQKFWHYNQQMIRLTFFSNHACAINWHLTNSNRDGCFLALIDNTYKIVVTFLARKVKNERNELYICHKSSFYCHQESLFALALAAMLAV